MAVRGRLTPEIGALLMQALAAARETLYQQGRLRNGDVADVSAETPTMGQQQADALALLAETALHHGIDPGAPGERYQVVVHVEEDQSVLENGARVSAETSQRIACDASRVVMRHGHDGHVVEVGARTRTIPPAIRRALHTETTAAASPAAAFASARAITSVTGPTAAPPRSRISLCSAAAPLAQATREAT